MLEGGIHLLADEFLPLRCFDFGDQPVAHREQHYHGREHRDSFHDLSAGRHRGEQGLEDDGSSQTGDHSQHYAQPDRAQSLAMSGLEQEGDDGADNENRLEAFAQNDEERLEERFPVAGWTLGEVDDGREAVGDRIA